MHSPTSQQNPESEVLLPLKPVHPSLFNVAAQTFRGWHNFATGNLPTPATLNEGLAGRVALHHSGADILTINENGTSREYFGYQGLEDYRDTINGIHKYYTRTSGLKSLYPGTPEDAEYKKDIKDFFGIWAEDIAMHTEDDPRREDLLVGFKAARNALNATVEELPAPYNATIIHANVYHSGHIEVPGYSPKFTELAEDLETQRAAGIQLPSEIVWGDNEPSAM